MTQTTLSVDIQEFEPSQYWKLVQVYDAIFPERARTVEEWRFFDSNLDRSKYHLKRYTCIERTTGEILGFGEVGHAPWMFHPRKFWTEIWVHPRHQGHGIGSAIYAKLLDDLKTLDAIAAWAATREDLTRPITFLENRGFKERMRGWESKINPHHVDASKFEKYSVEASNAGIRITTLAEEVKEDPECYPKLYDLVQTTFRDVPMPDPPTDTPYEQWLAFEMKNPNLMPEGYMIAKHRDRLVGVSAVWKVQNDPDSLYQGLTGVRREFRGKSIAVALKLRVLDFAKKNGYNEIRTFNATVNEAMLGINMKLGFKQNTGWITFEKPLEENS
ncbi:MAG TPA: GNAT family N-acetyltransferase [Candidatus Bathyarchaeia archaeon]|nr:GNAT family N-acetyltransferase [Candidatus Bathyarchaeia archaeon]